MSDRVRIGPFEVDKKTASAIFVGEEGDTATKDEIEAILKALGGDDGADEMPGAMDRSKYNATLSIDTNRRSCDKLAS
jgi:hypothetical protein